MATLLSTIICKLRAPLSYWELSSPSVLKDVILSSKNWQKVLMTFLLFGSQILTEAESWLYSCCSVVSHSKWPRTHVNLESEAHHGWY